MAPRDPSERYKLLLHSARSLSSTLHVDEVLQSTVDSLIELMGAERGFVAQVDESSGELRFTVARNTERQTLEAPEYEVSRTLIRKVLETGEGELLLSAADDPRYAQAKSIVAQGIRSLCCAPMRSKSRVLGVVCVDNRLQAGVFKAGDLELLTAFADQAAIALDNARLFDDSQRKAIELATIKAHQDSVFESMASGVIALDHERRITTFNAAAERIFGLSREQVLLQPVQLALALRGAACIEELTSRVLSTLRPVLAHRLSETFDGVGDVELSLQVAPLRSGDSGSVGVTVLIDDISERLRLEASLGATEARRRHLHASLERLVSEDVAYLVENNPAALSLGGESRTLTVLFCDITGFSTMSERCAPAQVIDMLNHYYAAMCKVVKRHNGLIKQFVGDEIMVLFNAIRDNPDHALDALRTAVDMAETLHSLRTAGNSGDTGFYHAKIGVHTGDVVLGCVGIEDRLEFTAVGDNVNLASRIMGLNNQLGTEVLASLQTVQAAGLPLPPDLSARACGSFPVKGRQQAVEVFELSSSATGAPGP